MTLTRDDPELARPIEDRGQLIDFFRDAETPETDWRVGTEHEKLGVYSDGFGPVPYEGERGIRALLEALRREHAFEGLYDEGRLVGLERDGASITLEPGGQLELSGAPFKSMQETCTEFRNHVALMKHVSGRFGIEWVGLGIHPLAPVDELPRMPRARYTIMRDFMSKRGEMALEMMHGTGCVQVNLDFSNEDDMARKMRVGMALSPIVTALYANSSISGGEPNGFISRRAWIWRHTDPARCGLLPFVFEESWREGAAYQLYAEWALDAPMIFILRDQRHISANGRTFREFLEQGQEGYTPSLADWNLHLTTLFPEVRLKRVVELRGADGVPAGLVCALPALWKGLFYDATALSDAEKLITGWTFSEVDALHVAVARSGLLAKAPGAPVLEVAKEILDLAARGLKGIAPDAPDAADGGDERVFLEPLYEIIERGASPGQHLLEHWNGAWHRRLDRLIEYARY